MHGCTGRVPGKVQRWGKFGALRMTFHTLAAGAHRGALSRTAAMGS
jgi:hypothetical protein